MRPARAAARERAVDLYRDAILSAAEAEFASRGYGATKMVDVARRAGMSVGALYRHFDSKEAIFASLLGRAGEAFVARLERAAADVAEPRARIAAVVATTLSFIQENRGMFLAFHQSGQTDLAACHALAEHVESHRNRMIELYRASIADGVAAGALRGDIAVDDQVALLSGAIHGFVETWWWSGGDAPVTAKAETVTRLVLCALEAGA